MVGAPPRRHGRGPGPARRVIDAAVSAAAGRVSEHTAEGVRAAFRDVAAAAVAAERAQRALSAEAWAPLPAPAVRMAVDVGDVDVRGEVGSLSELTPEVLTQLGAR